MIQIPTYTLESGIVMTSPVLVIVRVGYDALVHKTANGPRAHKTRPALPSLHGQLGLYPTAALATPAAGAKLTPPAKLIPFVIPNALALPAGTTWIDQLYAALMLQTAYKAGTLLAGG